MKKPHSSDEDGPPPKKEKLMEVDFGSRKASQGAKIHILPEDWDESAPKGAKTKLERMYLGFPGQVRKARSYSSERPKQILRWLATVIFQKFGGVEIQCYWDAKMELIYVSSNLNTVNTAIREAVNNETLIPTVETGEKGEHARITRHRYKLFHRANYDGQEPIWDALQEYDIVVPTAKHKHLHAERRIEEELGEHLDPKYLAGVKRPCLVCAYALKLPKSRPGPLWTTKAALGGEKAGKVLKHARTKGIKTNVTFDKVTGKLTTDFGSDSDSSGYSADEESD